MAVTTTKTNKPINPRGNDQSPKGYNRAELYTGKALDFDGVNDSIDISNFSLNGYTAFSICFHKVSDFNNGMIFSSADSIDDGVNIYQVSPGYFRARLNGYNIDTDLEVSTKDGFFVLTYDGSDFNWYYEAQNIGSDTTSRTFAITNTTSTIGRQSYAAAQYLNGQIAGFKIFNTALTAAQVSDLYNNPEKIVPTGVDNTALKLWLPMMEGAGTTAYNGAPDALGSNVVTNGTFDTDLTGWSTNDFSNGSIVQSSGTALITSNGGSGYPSIWQQVSTIVGERYIVKANFSNNTTGVWFWKFDDNTPLGSTNRVQFIDNDATGSIDAIFEFTATSTLSSISAFAEQGNAGSFNLDNVEVLQISNVGTISGATWTHGIGSPVGQTSVIDWNKHTLDGTNEVLIPQGLTAGRDLLGNLFENVRKQGALNLDGNSWAEVHDNASLDISDAITLEAWVYWDGTANNDGVLGRWFSGATSYMIYAHAGQLLFYTNTSSSAASISGTGWKHVIGTYDLVSRRIYIDGQEIGSGTAYNSPLATSDKPIEIGKYGGSGAAASYQNQIAQPRIYNRALTAEEVERNYNAGKNIYK